jgi:hypothetical protein
MTQMFFVVGALVLLGSVILGINQMLLIKTTTMLDAEASLAAASIGQSMIDEIMTQNYDAATDTGYGVDLKKVFNVALFTGANSLGCNSTESSNVPLPDTADANGVFRSAKYYNDVDDYNSYRRTVKTPVLGKFTVVDSVYYTLETNPDQKATTQTYYKKIVVTVTHRNMERPLKMFDVVVYRRYF